MNDHPRKTRERARVDNTALNQAEQTCDSMEMHCNKYWDNLLELWELSDTLMSELITHMKECPEEEFQQAGNTLKSVKEGWLRISATNHICENDTCRQDNENLRRIIKKNIKIMHILKLYLMKHACK